MEILVVFTTILELLNEGSDIAVLPLYYSYNINLFYASLTFLCLSMCARLCEVIGYYLKDMVEPSQTKRFLFAGLVNLVEPNVGILLLGNTLKKATLEESKAGQVIGAHSLVHENDRRLMMSIIRSSAVMLLTEDLPELIVAFYFLTGSSSSSLPAIFYLSFLMTVLHSARQVAEIATTYRFWSLNKFLIEHTTKSFRDIPYKEAHKWLEEYSSLLEEVSFEVKHKTSFACICLTNVPYFSSLICLFFQLF